MIFNYIRRKYPFRTIDELYLAFELAINDKLDIDDAKVYDQFSIEYLTRILNAYGRYVFKTMKDLKVTKHQLETTPLTDQDKMKDIQDYLEGPEPVIAPLYIYDFMTQLGMTKYTDEEKARMYREAINQRKRDLEIQQIKNPMDHTAKAELARLAENMKQHFAKATNSEISAIHTEYKKIVLRNYRNFYSQNRPEESGV